MKVFVSLLRWDLLLQLRQKFWHAGGVLTAVYIAVLLFVPQAHANLWVSALLFSEICTIGLLLVAGVVFLEKRQGSVYAFATTPVPTATWILSKLASLTLLGTTLGCVILLFKGENVNWLRVVLAISLGTAFYTLLGFILVSPVRRGITQYFPALFLALSITSIPVYWHFGIIEHPLLWVLPSYPAMKMLSGCLRDMPAVEFYSAAAVLILWNALAFYVSVRFFHRYISLRRGM